MNCKLNKNTKIIYKDNYIILKNIKSCSEITISIDFKDMLESIVSGQSVKNVITDFQKKYDMDFMSAQKQINTLLYALLHQKLIEINSEKILPNHSINIKSALIEITDCCNFKCPHCYVNKTYSNILNFEQIKDICTELQETINFCNVIICKNLSSG